MPLSVATHLRRAVDRGGHRAAGEVGRRHDVAGGEGDIEDAVGHRAWSPCRVVAVAVKVKVPTTRVDVSEVMVTLPAAPESGVVKELTPLVDR